MCGAPLVSSSQTTVYLMYRRAIFVQNVPLVFWTSRLPDRLFVHVLLQPLLSLGSTHRGPPKAVGMAIFPGLLPAQK